MMHIGIANSISDLNRFEAQCSIRPTSGLHRISGVGAMPLHRPVQAQDGDHPILTRRQGDAWHA